MTRLLLQKSFREARWLLLGCCTAVFAFCWLRVWIVSRLSTERFQAILDLLPADWRRFLAVDFDWLITYPGRISLAYQELLVVLCVCIWSIARGSDVVSGELNRGTMEMLLAQPLSRIQLLMSQSLVATLGAFVLAWSAWGGTCAGIYTTVIKEESAPQLNLPIYIPGLGNRLPLPFGERQVRHVPMSHKVHARLFIPATLNLFALGMMMTGVSTLLSSWDRYRWRTIGLSAGILVAQLLLKIAGMAADGWEWLKYFSVLSAYEPEVHVRLADTSPGSVWMLWHTSSPGSGSELAPLGQNLLLIGIGLVSFVAAAWIFARRDLPAPL